MSYLVPVNGAVTLQKAIEPGGIVVFQSASWEWDSSWINDQTSVNMLAGDDHLLHISMRQGQNAIVFNSRTANGAWGIEERKPLQGAFVTPSASITVCDHGDRYQILFSFQTVHYYAKRIKANTTHVSYHINPGQTSPFSDLLVVSTYGSMGEIAMTNYRAYSEVRPIPPLEKTLSGDFATTKATFSHGVGPIARPGQKKKDRLGFEYAEHCFLGDAVILILSDGRTITAKDAPFKLYNGLEVTYGEINGLAGDFYGTYDPISDGSNEQQQLDRFLSAYQTLSTAGPRQPSEAIALLTVLNQEVDAVNTALHNHEDPSVAYSKLKDETWEFERITWGRSGIPGYLGLARINWDHFGADARTAYNAGHSTALEAAVKGNLEDAYTLNAFADHFLEDSFSAGHLRTPRRLLHSKRNPSADICAKFIHDEDCAIGISVQNPDGQRWMVYGDKRALDTVDEDNKKRCLAAVQASADEIYHAWKTQRKPDRGEYKAWNHAATLDSATGNQTLAPLFKSNNQRRQTITNRYNWIFTSDWWYATTAALCKNSGWWKYPITIDGPQGTLSGSAVAAVALSTWSCRVYCQDAQGGILEAAHDGIWSPRSSALFRAKMFTPLAVISWDSGRQIRIYYLSENDVLQEYCWSSGSGWASGYQFDSNFRVASNSSIAAVQWSDQGSTEIRLYVQGSSSDAIQEYCSNPWRRGSTLPTARTGSSIAAVKWMQNGIHIRVYYQDPDLAVREHCFDTGGWYHGEFNRVIAPRHASSAALCWYDSNVQLRVYWQDGQQDFVCFGWAIVKGWGSVRNVKGPFLAGTHISALDWNTGKNIRLYYQGANDAILEQCSDNDDPWFTGSSVA